MKVTRFKHTNRVGYGGYITYLKLYAQLWTMLITGNGLTMEGPKMILPLLKVMLGITLILKTPWWLLIKPLGCLFSKLIISEGVYKLDDSETVLLSFEGEKFTTYKFLGCPYWAWNSSKFSEEEKMERSGLE